MAAIGRRRLLRHHSRAERRASKTQGFSAEDLARAFADRLEQLGPRYNALALPLPPGSPAPGPGRR